MADHWDFIQQLENSSGSPPDKSGDKWIYILIGFGGGIVFALIIVYLITPTDSISAIKTADNNSRNVGTFPETVKNATGVQNDQVAAK